MNLKKLIADIKKDAKMSPDDINCTLVESIEDEESTDETYKILYQKAYGDKLNKTLAECWVHNMDITDNSERQNGEKWTLEQTLDVGNKIGIDWTKFGKYDWYAVLNASYSDFYNTAKKMNKEDDPIFFASLAKDFWICDEDVNDKTPFSYYFTYVI